MANRVCVIDVPGLSRALLGEIPESSRWGQWMKKAAIAPLTPVFPALTCPMQATLTTGVPPARHGIISNGLPAFRSAADQELVDSANFSSYRKQISFWEQSNQLIEAPRFWQDESGKSKWKTALLFMQNCMPGFAGAAKPAADIVITPKPDHGADGKLVSLCWSEPGDLVAKLFGALGPFPLMNYWGPMAGIASTQWIVRAGAMVWRELQPQLQWTYLPHLDYDLQRFGPSSAQARKAVADLAVATDVLFEELTASGAKIVVLSEYTLSDVTGFVQPNRLLAEAGLLQTRETPDGKLIDYERSGAFAMVDHQIAHVYAKDSQAKQAAMEALQVAGVNFADESLRQCAHRRRGDLVLIASPDRWFDYRWWARPEDAPVFAGMVDIHRKPGYDPCELFFDPAARAIQQNPGLVRGSHGSIDGDDAVWMSEEKVLAGAAISLTYVATEIARMLQ